MSERSKPRSGNRIVHFYWEMDLGEVHRILAGRLADFDLYLVAVERYLDSAASRQ